MAKQKENIPIIFTLSLGGEDAMLQRLNKEKATIVIPIFSLKVNEIGAVPDKDRIMREIITGAEKEKKVPIANIQFSSNEFKPIVELQDLKNYKNLGIKTSFTFNNYKSLSQESELNNTWKELLANIDHVFFTKEQDQNYAINNKLIPREKTTNIQNESPENLLSVFNNLANNRPAIQKSENILLSGILPDKTKLNELAKTAKDQGKRIVISNTSLSTEEASNAIALKFGIDNQDQLLGIKLEVADILKNQANGAKNLERYIAQLSQQFQKDLGTPEINPVDINFDIADKQRVSNMEKVKNTDNHQSPPNPSILSQKTKPIKQATFQASSSELQKKIEEDNPTSKKIFSKIFNYIKNLANSFKEVIFGRKKEEVKQTKNSPSSSVASETSQTEKSQWGELGVTKEEYTKMLEESTKAKQQLASKNKSPSTTNIASSQDNAFRVPLEAEDINNVKKPEYWYQDYQIQHILKASLDENKVSIQPAISLANTYDKEGKATDARERIFKSILNIAIDKVKEGKESAVIPLEMGYGLWTGMLVTYDKKEDQVIITYNDSMGNSINSNNKQLPNLIEESLKELPNKPIIIDEQTKQQNNQSDCGVFTTDNLIKLAKGERIFSTEKAKDMGIELRKAHAEILNKELINQQAQEICNNAKKQSTNFISRINNNNKERTR